VAILTVASLTGIDAAAGQDRASEQGRLLVAAASSLGDLLPEVQDAWSAAGGAPVNFSFDATSRLAPQIVAGSPVDLFVSADRAWVDWLVRQGAADGSTARALWSNSLVVVVPSGQRRPSTPAELLSLDRVALAAEETPAGRYGAAALAEAGVYEALSPRIVRGGSVRGTLEWIARHEADAGVVYRTDASGDARVDVAFELPTGAGGGVRYVGIVPTTASDPSAAAELLDYLASAEVEAVAVGRGFTPGAGAQSGAADPAIRPPTVDPWSAVRLSLLVGLSAVVLGLAPAIGVGWVLARKHFRGKTLVSMVFLAPLVVPPVVTGFLLLELMGRNATLGALFAALGIPVSFSLFGAVIAALVVGFPLYVVAVRGAFEAVDHRYEELSWTLGVPRAPTFRRVSLPLAMPGIAAGALLAFARALGEFGATVVLAGNVEGETRTIALAVYSLLESPSGRGGTWTLVIASLLLSFGALVGYEALSRRQRRRLLDTPGH
jgi:molybdate transport system permease protein